MDWRIVWLAGFVILFMSVGGRYAVAGDTSYSVLTLQQLLAEWQTCKDQKLPEGCLVPKRVRDIIGSTLPLISTLQANRIPFVANNASLQQTNFSTYGNVRVVRLGYVTPGDGGAAAYTLTSSACTAADNGAQVSISGGCAIADFAGVRPTPQVWGAKCDGTTDDTTALQAWLNTATNDKTLYLPSGICAFKTPLTTATGLSGVSILGNGGHTSILKYIGTSTTVDLLSVGSLSNANSGWTLEGFRITSGTAMTAGAGLHIIRMGRSTLNDIVVDGQDGSGLLYNGIWFDRVDMVTWKGGEARGSNDALRVNGGIGVSEKADLFISHLKIASSAVGIHIGGAFGGFSCDQSDVIVNGINVLVDHTLTAEGNREIMFGPNCWIDGASTGDGIKIDDNMTNTGQFYAPGWVASSAAAGIHIVAWPNSFVSIPSATIFNNATDGVLVDDAATYIAIGDQTQIRANFGWGVNATFATDRIYTDIAPLNNTTGAFSPLTHVEFIGDTAGYRKFASGLIYQYGQVTFTGVANSILAPVGGNPRALPLVCPSAQMYPTMSATTSGFPNGAQNMTAQATPDGLTGINLVLVSSGTVTNAQTVNWTAWCK